METITADNDELHEHLEIDHGSVYTYVNVFDAHPDLIHVIIGKQDKEEQVKFNKFEMFLSKEEFGQLANFFGDVKRKKNRKNLAEVLEHLSLLSQEWENAQQELVEESDVVVDPNQVSFSRDMSDDLIIKQKLRSSKSYCKRFYSTLCNNELFKGEFGTGYSWRATGGLIADLLGQGDYMDWYCSGNEGLIDEEVEQDLARLGWVVKPYDDEGVDTTGDLF